MNNEVKITELTELESANVSNTDVLPIVDVSADETKKIKIENIKTVVNDSYSTSTTETYSANYINNNVGTTVHDSYSSSTTEPYSANYVNNLPSGEGGGIIALKSITTAPSTFSEGDKYYNASDDLIYTATSSSEWDSGTTASATSLYLNEADNELYRYYNNTMNLLEGGSGGGSRIEIGTIFQYPGTTAPTNYMICDGSTISRTTYADLFAVIGTTYGAGDGSTTFNIPDLKGKVVVGLDSNDTDFDTLGETGGEKTHKLGISELPKSTPTFRSGNDGNFNMTYVGTNGNFTADTITQTNQNNLQPYMTLNYIIKVTQSADGGETLPVGSEIDFSGNVSDIPAGWEQVSGVNYTAYELYSDTTGSTGTITLSDSSANYSYLEIYYKSAHTAGIISSKIDVSLGTANNVALMGMSSSSATDHMYIAVCIYTLSGTSLTPSNYREYNVYGSSIDATSNKINIFKVVGLKEE